jgi:hypothetical protein
MSSSSAASAASVTIGSNKRPAPVAVGVWKTESERKYGKVRKIYDEGRSVTLQMKALNQELMCCVCQSVMREPSFIKTCMDRFCYSCIETWLRQSKKKQCPKCNCIMTSKRVIERDYRLEALIKVLYPDLSSLEEQEASKADAVISSLNTEGFAERMERGTEVQEIYTRQIRSERKMREATRKKTTRTYKPRTHARARPSSSSSSSSSTTTTTSSSSSSAAAPPARTRDTNVYLPTRPETEIGFWLRAYPFMKHSHQLQGG